MLYKSSDARKNGVIIYRGFLQAAVPSKSRLGRQKGLAAV